MSQTLMCCLFFFGPLSSRPNQVAEKVAARISENFSEAAIVMVTAVTLVYAGINGMKT